MLQEEPAEVNQILRFPGITRHGRTHTLHGHLSAARSFRQRAQKIGRPSMAGDMIQNLAIAGFRFPNKARAFILETGLQNRGNVKRHSDTSAPGWNRHIGWLFRAEIIGSERRLQ